MLTDAKRKSEEGPKTSQCAGLAEMPATNQPLWADPRALWCSYADRVGRSRPGAPCPDFLTICPAKTGTTWLAYHLARHSSIYVPPEKELSYFIARWRSQNIDWYAEQFAPAGRRLKGESTPGYAFLPSFAIQLIQRMNPRLKLIFLARRLPERAWSQARHSYRYGESTFRGITVPFDQIPAAGLITEFLADHNLASADYPGALRRWLDFFPAEQFHVRYMEEAFAHPEDYIRDVLRFLGVGDGLPPGDLTAPVHKGIDASMPRWAAAFLESLFARRHQETEALLEAVFGLNPVWRPPEPAAHEPLWLEDLPEAWRISLHDGAFHAVSLENGERMCSDFLDDVRNQIGRRYGRRPPVPGLSPEDQRLTAILDVAQRDIEKGGLSLVGSVQGFSIVRWQNRFWGVRQSLGHVDITVGEEELTRRYRPTDVFATDTRAEVEAQIEAIEARGAVESLISRLADVRHCLAGIAESLSGIAVAQSALQSVAAAISQHAALAPGSLFLRSVDGPKNENRPLLPVNVCSAEIGLVEGDEWHFRRASLDVAESRRDVCTALAAIHDEVSKVELRLRRDLRGVQDLLALHAKELEVLEQSCPTWLREIFRQQR